MNFARYPKRKAHWIAIGAAMVALILFLGGVAGNLLADDRARCSIHIWSGCGLSSGRP